MVAHGFSSARESFLVLIDPFLGEKVSSWTDRFVQLHGMLFSRLQLDAFDDQVDSFLDTGLLSGTHSQWAILAVTNIAALYQYNRKDSLLKESLRLGRREKRELEPEESIPSTEDPNDSEMILPPSEISDIIKAEELDPRNTFQNMPNEIRGDDAMESNSLSNIVFKKGCQLAFAVLSEAVNMGCSTPAIVHLHIWLVFLAYALRYQPVVYLVERYVPWKEIADALNEIVDDTGGLTGWNTREKELTGPVLSEDAIIRGYEWSRKFFPKNWFEEIDPLEEISETDSESCARKTRIIHLGIEITKALPKGKSTDVDLRLS
jgi:protein SMG6